MYVCMYVCMYVYIDFACDAPLLVYSLYNLYSILHMREVIPR